MIWLLLNGGPSQVDTFDYKPELQKRDGQKLPGANPKTGFFTTSGKLLKSPFEFQRYGKSGAWVSELFPHVARHIDDIAFMPIAALLKDLKSRGLLGSTLLICGGEFGRTSDSQGSKARNHNPHAFTTWITRAGVKGGTHYGETDEFGYKAVTDRVSVHDLHATILHLLGMDHEKLTYRFNGCDFRLTDVYGNVVHDIIA